MSPSRALMLIDGMETGKSAIKLTASGRCAVFGTTLARGRTRYAKALATCLTMRYKLIILNAN